MPYTAPHTIAVNELVTVATMNNEWGGNAAFLANPPACRVYNSIALTHTASGSWQALSGLDSERYDTDGMHSTSVNTGRITIKTAGLYVVGGSIEFVANTVGIRGLEVMLNGTLTIVNNYFNATSAFAMSLQVCTAYKFAVNDYIELVCFQNSGGNLGIGKVNNLSPEFHATWVGLG